MEFLVSTSKLELSEGVASKCNMSVDRLEMISIQVRFAMGFY